MPENIDLRQVRFYLENARAGAKYLQQEGHQREGQHSGMPGGRRLKELRRAEPVPATQESAVPRFELLRLGRCLLRR